MLTMIITPPIVGVPALPRCARITSSSRICWPNLRRRSQAMRPGPISIVTTNAVAAPPRARKVPYWKIRSGDHHWSAIRWR